MSLLLDLAGQLAPHFSFFAARMADGVMQGAVDRIADRTVDAGEGVFRSLVAADGPTGDDATALTAETADDLDRRLGQLSDEQRATLASALTTWLEGPHGRDGLVPLVKASGPHVSVQSHGDYNTVIGSVGTFNQYPRDGRP
ncbi:hypothetical protein FKN01_25195 [Streptomyces sp. 130]|uniref:hypothetical protein n=1 Tax=Streptomyces sp. 130 TaxID=2591006 RepID=UPI00117F1C6D|nr:hypothetical protein [Streptomyces sp. 130]TRV74290.1 hypothetical protein FKN01_25195 [Streptomyces sp. 130]